MYFEQGKHNYAIDLGNIKILQDVLIFIIIIDPRGKISDPGPPQWRSMKQG